MATLPNSINYEFGINIKSQSLYNVTLLSKFDAAAMDSITYHIDVFIAEFEAILTSTAIDTHRINIGDENQTMACNMKQSYWLVLCQKLM